MLRKRTIAVMAGATVVMALIPWRAEADQVINDDLIVIGSLCVGFDCVNGEVFGFDTIKMKENNTRLRFEDTSTSASFPPRDWRIVANDSSNGGDNYLAFEDTDNGYQSFRVEAGAGANALFVESGGDVGISTGNPAVDLHIQTGNTPTVRLDQDGTNGFTPQVWDVAGNEANFFIRDVTNGSKLSFRIRPGAPTSAIDIAADGDVGFRTGSPTADLHVSGANNIGALRLDRAGNVRAVLNDTSVADREWAFGTTNTGGFSISRTGVGNVIIFNNDGTINCIGRSGGTQVGAIPFC